LTGMAPNPIQVGKGESCLPSLTHPSELGCDLSLDAFNNFGID